MVKVNKLKYTTHMGGVIELDDVDPLLAIRALFVTLDGSQQNDFFNEYGTQYKHQIITDAVEAVKSSKCYGTDKENAMKAVANLSNISD